MEKESIKRLGNGKLYTQHGIKRNQGEIVMINDKIALAFVDKSSDKPIGYTFLDEMLLIGNQFLQ